jgi:hypothetical protein
VLDGFPDIALDFPDSSTGRYAARQIGDIGGKIVFAVLDYDRILLHGFPFSPA